MENLANSTEESKKSGLSGGDLLGMRSSLNTPPPGFRLGDFASFHGQNLTARRAAAASAPPTSLFANNLFDSNFTSLQDDFDRFSNKDIADRDSYRMNLLRGKNQDDKPRTMSYNNLAAALGEGLAESMGHSLVDSNNGNGSAPDIAQDDLRVNGNEVDNFARQNRHSSRNRRTHSNSLLNGSNDDNMKKFEEVSSQFSNISIGGSPSAVSNPLKSNHRVTVVEPSPCSTPALALMGGDFNISTAKTSKDPFKFELGTKALDLSSSSLFKVGRASAPPLLFEHSSPRKDPILNHVQTHVSISRSRTPMSPAIQSNSANLVPKNNISVHSQQQQSYREDPSFKDLSNFTWEKDNNDTDYPSRALAIFGLFGLQLSEVKSTCEAFGSILYFRTEFFASRGIILIAYHDLRSANHAVKELQSYLQKMVSMNGSQTAVKVMFCISLTSSSDRDESTLVISNLPMSIRENSVKDLLSSTFGALRSIRTEAPGCYVVEFFDIQDASQALLEMQSTMPWGPSAILTTKLRQDYERQRGKDLFAVMGKWRQEIAQHTSNGMNEGGAQFDRPVVDSRQYVATKSPSPSQDGQTHTTESSSTSHIAYQQQPTAQLVVGPDGQYTYIIMQQQQPPPPQYAMPQMQQGHIQAGAPHAYVPNSFDGQQNFDGHGYWVQQAHPAVQQVQHPHGVAYVTRGHVHGVMPHQQVVDPTRHHNLPQHVPGYVPAMASHVAMGAPQMNGGKSPTRRGSQEQNQDSNDLYLSIEAVKSGQDHRTSLMVRNIPNKYTQSMLLSEFKESGHGPGKIDFFYLPIDFRNKCNRGYAFINFVDSRDIVSFYECYNGKSWKIFKSEKICCITYARIQGKEGMMKRFQNSALMEKDQAYRPLVFGPTGDVVHEEVS